MNNRYAITFGEVSILHVGGKEYGEKRDIGFSCNELKDISKKFPQNSEYISISDKLPAEKRLGNEAGILIFRSKEKNNEDDGAGGAGGGESEKAVIFSLQFIVLVNIYSKCVLIISFVLLSL